MEDETEEIIEEFLEESNLIEREYSMDALTDALKAWEYAYENRGNITVKYILEIHRLLAKNLRPDIAGKVRDCSVMIGYHIKKKKPEEELLLELREWIENCIPKGKKATEKEVQKWHVKFEAIHPHEDFNGRTGRILWQIQRINNGLPIKIIYEKEKYSYYKWFK